MVASLLRNGKILRASTVARVSLNHETVTGHITLASLKTATASIRFTLNFPKTTVSLTPFCSLPYERYWDPHGLPWDFRFPSTLVPGFISWLSKLQIQLKHRTTSAYNWDLGINVPVAIKVELLP